MRPNDIMGKRPSCSGHKCLLCGQLLKMDETALAVLACVAGVSDKSTRGDFVN